MDGAPVALETETQRDDMQKALSSQAVATFGSGLPPGWHHFSGRWYDRGRLVLTSERSIQFVEP